MITLYWYLEDLDGNTVHVGSYGECIGVRNELAAKLTAHGWKIAYEDRKRTMHATKFKLKGTLMLSRNWKLDRVQLPRASL